jgi:hypothetical protein
MIFSSIRINHESIFYLRTEESGQEAGIRNQMLFVHSIARDGFNTNHFFFGGRERRKLRIHKTPVIASCALRHNEVISMAGHWHA